MRKPARGPIDQPFQFFIGFGKATLAMIGKQESAHNVLSTAIPYRIGAPEITMTSGERLPSRRPCAATGAGAACGTSESEP
jgi:hypothetical protein